MEDFKFYFGLGLEHILSIEALDHLLFILALVVVYTMEDLKRILILVTAFTIGHSITLALSSFDIIHLSSAWVEFLIPITILITALDNIIFRIKHTQLMIINYALALIFGLVHGMGFANSARMMLAREQDLLAPLLGFNLGVEMGQLVVVPFFLVFSFIVFKIFRVNKGDWVMFISSGVFALSLQMALERLP